MPLDPYLAERVRVLEGVTFDLDSAAATDAFAEWMTDPGPWVEPAGLDIADLSVPGPHGSIPVRTYRHLDQHEGTLVWVHGGGFAAGTLDWPEAHVVSAELCARTGFVVVSVDYRLATEGVRFPIPLDDVSAVWAWATHTFGSAGPCALGGASAGAALALAAAMIARDGEQTTPSHLLLAYPFAHFPIPALDDALAVEMTTLPAALRFPPATVEWMTANYVGRLSDLPPLALPGAASMAGLPPVQIIACEFDDLRGSADLLERQLIEAGVVVDNYLAVGMPHGHLNRLPSLPETDRSLDVLARFLTDQPPGSAEARA